MKKLLLLTLIMLLTSCSQEVKKTKASISLLQLAGTDKYDGGLYLTGHNYANTQKFLIPLDNENIELEIPNGMWRMAIIGWKNKNEDHRAFEGDMFCDVKRDISLEGQEANLVFDLKKNKCLAEFIASEEEDFVHEGQIRPIRFASCRDFERALQDAPPQVNANDFKNGSLFEPSQHVFCSAAAGNKGSHQSFQLTVKASGTFTQPASESTRCFNINQNQQLLAHHRNTQVRMPLGYLYYPREGDGPKLHFPVEVKSFPGLDCAGTPIVYDFSEGLGKRDRNANNDFYARGFTLPWSATITGLSINDFDNEEALVDYIHDPSNDVDLVFNAPYQTLMLSTSEEFVDIGNGAAGCTYDGEGTSERPKIICSLADLQTYLAEIDEHVGDKKHITLAQDLDFSSLVGQLSAQNVVIRGSSTEPGHEDGPIVIDGNGDDRGDDDLDLDSPRSALFSTFNNVELENIIFRDFVVSEGLIANQATNIILNELSFENIASISSETNSQGLLFNMVTLNNSHADEYHWEEIEVTRPRDNQEILLKNTSAGDTADQNIGGLAGTLSLAAVEFKLERVFVDLLVNIPPVSAVGGAFGKITRSDNEKIQVEHSHFILSSFIDSGTPLVVTATQGVAGIVGHVPAGVSSEFLGRQVATEIHISSGNNVTHSKITPFLGSSSNQDLSGDFLTSKITVEGHDCGSCGYAYDVQRISAPHVYIDLGGEMAVTSGLTKKSFDDSDPFNAYVSSDTDYGKWIRQYNGLAQTGNDRLPVNFAIPNDLNPIEITSPDDWNYYADTDGSEFSGNLRRFSSTFIITSDLDFGMTSDDVGNFKMWSTGDFGFRGSLFTLPHCPRDNPTNPGSCILSNIAVTETDPQSPRDNIGVISYVDGGLIGHPGNPIHFSNVKIFEATSTPSANLGIIGKASSTDGQPNILSLQVSHLEVYIKNHDSNAGGVLGYLDGFAYLQKNRIENLSFYNILNNTAPLHVGGFIGRTNYGSFLLKDNYVALDQLPYFPVSLNYEFDVPNFCNPSCINNGFTAEDNFGGFIGNVFGNQNSNLTFTLDNNHFELLTYGVGTPTGAPARFGLMIGATHAVLDGDLEEKNKAKIVGNSFTFQQEISNLDATIPDNIILNYGTNSGYPWFVGYTLDSEINNIGEPNLPVFDSLGAEVVDISPPEI